MHRLVQILARQFERARFLFQRHDAQAQHVAEVAQAAPGDRADASRAAGDKAADRSRAPSRREHPHFLPGRRGGFVDVDQERARFADDSAVLDRPDCVHLREVQEHAAGQRHRLAVIAGSGAAGSHGNSELVRGGKNGPNLGLALRRNHDVSGHRLELALQHRRIPIEVAALLLDQDGIVLPLDQTDLSAQRRDVVGPAHGARPSSASSSA